MGNRSSEESVKLCDQSDKEEIQNYEAFGCRRPNSDQGIFIGTKQGEIWKFFILDGGCFSSPETHDVILETYNNLIRSGWIDIPQMELLKIINDVADRCI